MSETGGLDEGQIRSEAVLEQLNRILSSEKFSRSPRLKSFLEFIVRQTLNGNENQLKGTQIALTVFGQDESFDGSTNPLIRVQARNLRQALKNYYDNEGSEDPIRIEMPKGQYSAYFAKNRARVSSYVEPAIAVLPFVTIGNGEDPSIFTYGLTQELILALNQYAELSVVVRQSDQQQTGKVSDVRKAGKNLGVRFILRGSIQMMGQSIRVNTQLLDCETGDHLWIKNYDHELTDRNLFELQDTIARDVVQRITGVYGVIFDTLEKETRGRRPYTFSVYQAILKFYRYNSQPSRDYYYSARSALESAVKKEPNLALPWALLGETYVDGFTLGFSEDETPLLLAEQCARKAIEYEPSCQHAFWTLVQVHFHNRDTMGCKQCLEKVYELNPNAMFFVAGVGWQTALIGDWETGLGILHEAMGLNPDLPGWLNLAPFQDCYRRGDYQGALSYASRFDTPTIAWDQIVRAVAYHKLGETQSAERAIHELLTRNPGFSTRATQYIRCYVYEDELAADILVSLRNAGLPSDPT